MKKFINTRKITAVMIAAAVMSMMFTFVYATGNMGAAAGNGTVGDVVGDVIGGASDPAVSGSTTDGTNTQNGTSNGTFGTSDAAPDGMVSDSDGVIGNDDRTGNDSGSPDLSDKVEGAVDEVIDGTNGTANGATDGSANDGDSADGTATEEDGSNMAVIIIAILIAVAIVAVIIALIPRKRN